MSRICLPIRGIILILFQSEGNFAHQKADCFFFAYRYAAARGFLEAKAKVILVNRQWDTGSDAIHEIKNDFGRDALVEWYHCDLGNLKETKEVFDGIREREKRLDIVCPRLLRSSSFRWVSSSIVIRCVN